MIYSAWQERLNTGNRTIGGLFYIMNEVLPDIRLMDAFVYLLQVLSQIKLKLTSQLNNIIAQFMAHLPVAVQKVLNLTV